MNKIIIISILSLLSINLVAQEKRNGKEKITVTFKVEMDGQCCVNEIKDGFLYEKGIKKIECDYDKKTVSITYREDKTDLETLLNTFIKLNKNAEIITPKRNS